MEDAYGRLHEDDPPPVDPQAAARLEAELTGIQERLRELGYKVEGNGRWWIAAAGVTVRDVDSGRFPDHPSRLIRTTASGDIFAVLVPAGTDVQPPGSNPLAWVTTAPGEAGSWTSWRTGRSVARGGTWLSCWSGRTRSRTW